MDALDREIAEEVGIEAPPFEGPIAIVDSIAPGRTFISKHVVHIIFAGELDGSLEVGLLDRRGRARAPALRPRRAGRDRAPPADPALPAALAAGRSGRVPRRALDAVKDACSASTAELRGGVPRHAGEPPGRPRRRSTELIDALVGRCPEAGAEDAQVIAELIAGAEPGVVAHRRAAATSGSSSAARCRPPSRPTGWPRRGTRTRVSSSPRRPPPWWRRSPPHGCDELLGLPERRLERASSPAAQGANMTALAAARQHVLAQAGWDVARDGLNGAPRIRVLVGGERHVTVDRVAAPARARDGSRRARCPSDDQGRMRRGRAARRAPGLATGPTIVCAQAGNVNTGASDPFDGDRRRLRTAPARGCTSTARSGSGRPPALASAPGRRGRARRLLGDRRSQVAERAVRLRRRLLRASGRASRGDGRRPRATLQRGATAARPIDWVPESSRRARGFAVCAALRALGRSGVAELVDRCCDHARTFARAARRASPASRS